MTRLRLGVDARTMLSPHPRGEGKTLLRLYQGLAQARPEWSFVLYGDAHCVNPGIAGDVCVKCFNVSDYRFNGWSDFALPVMAMLDRVDLMHCPSSTAPRLFLRPTVVTVHDVIPMVFDDGLSQAGVRRFRRGVHWALKRARSIIAVSESTRRDLIALRPSANCPIDVIHWGHEASAPPADRIQRVASLGVASPFVLLLGGESPRKNSVRAVKAFVRAAASGRLPPGTTLAIVGVNSASLRDEAIGLAKAGGVMDRVKVLGYIDEADLAALYSQALVFFYPSLYEGFGLPPLEALGYGTTVVASSRTSVPEVVGEAALLVDPEDVESMASALCSAATDQALRTHLSQAARGRLVRFSWPEAVERTARVFERAALGDRP